MTAYAGIDESNPGLTNGHRAIYTALVSHDPRDILPAKGLPKVRHRIHIPDFLGNGYLVHVAVSPAFRRLVPDDRRFRLEILQRLIEEIVGREGSIADLIIDGELKRSVRRGLEDRFGRSVFLHPEVNADTRYPLVNRADAIARMLYHVYGGDITDLGQAELEFINSTRVMLPGEDLAELHGLRRAQTLPDLAGAH